MPAKRTRSSGASLGQANDSQSFIPSLVIAIDVREYSLPASALAPLVAGAAFFFGDDPFDDADIRSSYRVRRRRGSDAPASSATNMCHELCAFHLRPREALAAPRSTAPLGGGFDEAHGPLIAEPFSSTVSSVPPDRNLPTPAPRSAARCEWRKRVAWLTLVPGDRR